MAPADLAVALERGKGPCRPRRSPLDADDAPAIPPRTSSRLAAFFGRHPRPRAEEDPPRPGAGPEGDDDAAVGLPPWPLPPWPLPPITTATLPGETRIRIQTPIETEPPRRAPASSLGGGLGPGTMASISREEGSLTDETATDSLGVRLHRAGSQAAK